MKLSYFSRTVGKKSEVNRLRREGCIPAVFYGQSQAVQPIFVKQDEVAGILREMHSRPLATEIFELYDGRKSYRALIKEIQYHRTTYAIEHIDFIFIADNSLVTVNVPIQITGAAECVGVKLGGFVRQVIRSIKVVCLPQDIPRELVLDVRDMQIAQSKRLSDLVIPAGVRVYAKMNEVAVVIAKKV